ncbi:MAG: arginine--tRNA ligase, partial [Clostridia bacterium]|nr:arginine--tRNA ligase [Clostridia bacterium]
MIHLKQQTSARLAEIAEEKFPGGTLTAEEVYGMLEYPPTPEMGDLALPCFKLSRSLRRAPAQISDALAEALSGDPLFLRVESVKGYLNLFFDPAALAKRVTEEVAALGDKYGSPMDGEGKTVVLDYSSPNVAKPFHI